MEEKIERQDFERSAIISITQKYGFEEKFEIKESSNENEEIQIKTIRRGIFKDDEGHLAIISNFVKPQNIPRTISKFFNNRFDLEKIYEGEKYLLCLANSKIYSYNIDYYLEMNAIIDEFEFEQLIHERRLKIGFEKESSMHVLIIETNLADFIIAGIMPDNQEEEERVRLSNKLEASQPFFEFKAPIHFDWNNLLGDKDRQFERICELLLQKESNIMRIIPIGKTRAADRGRDFEVFEKIEGFNSNSERRWLVQCKFSENSISPSSIAGWTDRVIEHKYDGFWLMTNNDITPNLFDQFKDVEKNDSYEIKTKIWQRSDFHVKLNIHSELFINNDIFEIK